MTLVAPAPKGILDPNTGIPAPTGQTLPVHTPTGVKFLVPPQ